MVASQNAGVKLLELLTLLLCLTTLHCVAQVNPPHQNTSNVHAIVEQAYQFLALHQLEGQRCWAAPNPPYNTTCYNYHFYRPSLTKYAAGQWLWDSGSH